jgi:flagellar hook assembly protein FlgD
MLSQNYPNPFNPSTTISFSVPVEGNVVLNIYDITGRLVTTLVDTNMNSGYHSVNWDGVDMVGEGVSAGLYIYSLQAEGVALTRKMVLMK